MNERVEQREAVEQKLAARQPSAASELLHRPTPVVAILTAIFVSLILATSSQKSAAFDEPFHFASGLLYVESGRIVRPPDHPPLIRELSGLSLHLAGVRLRDSPDVRAVLQGEGGDLEYPIGFQVMTDSGPDRVLAWARLPVVVLAGVFLVTLYLFSRALVGELAALCAVFLCTFDPILLSNWGLVYTDAPVALFGMLTIYTLWRYVERPTWWRILWCGLALGAALATKYSAVVFFPVIAVLLLLAKWWPPFAVQATGRPASAPVRNYAVAFVAMGAIAFSVLLYVFLFPKNPAFYLEGMHEVNRNHDPHYLSYLAGEYGKHFYRYYVEAWLLKEPLAIVLLTAAGVVALLRSTAVSRVACLFLLVPAGALLVGYSLASDNLGVRYIVPVLPFVLVAAGAGMAWLWHGTPWMRRGAVVLAVWLVAACAGVYPDHMNYFNEAACLLSEPAQLSLAGGTRCGPAWLDDSNVDNGEAVKELRTWLEQNAADKRVYLGYFSSFPAEAYGIVRHANDYPLVIQGTQPGTYVVSAQLVARAHPGPGSNGAAWLLSAKPVAFVGHTYFVYQK